MSDIRLEPGRVSRRFFPVPEGASRLDVAVRRPWDATEDTKRLVAVHAVQLRPHCSYRDGEAEKFVRIAPGEEKSVSLRVHGGGMVEVAVSQFWSGAAACTVGLSAEFRGLDVRADSGSDQVSLEARRFSVRNTLRPVSVKPSATLSRLLRRVEPAHSVVTLLPDASRDTLPSGKRLYALRSTFRFQAVRLLCRGRLARLPEARADARCPTVWSCAAQPVDGKCKLVAPLVNNSLYESPVDGQVMLVSERGSCALGISDTYPEEMELIAGVAYEATLELRHERPQLLAGLKSTPVWLDTPLAKVRAAMHRFPRCRPRATTTALGALAHASVLRADRKAGGSGHAGQAPDGGRLPLCLRAPAGRAHGSVCPGPDLRAQGRQVRGRAHREPLRVQRQRR